MQRQQQAEKSGFPLLKVEKLTVEYGKGEEPVTALNEVSLEIPARGYTLGVVGESGSGKTTLGMSIMNAIEPPGRIVKGRVSYQDKNILELNKRELNRYRWEEVAMVFQSAMNSLNPVKNVSDPIIEVMRRHAAMSKTEAREKALKLLAEVGIDPKRAEDYPHEFSGGMRQRVIVALALALSPKLLIADEPTSALDVVVQKQILKLLKREILDNRLSLIFITHDISLLLGLVENVAVMFSGEIVELGELRGVLAAPLHPYAESLLASLLTVNSVRRQKSARGARALEPDQIGKVKNACPYASRCKYVFERCRVERPLLKAASGGRLVACHKYNS